MKSALVFGGSSGIGRKLVEDLGQAEWAITSVARSHKQGKGERLQTLKVDVCSSDEVRNAFENHFNHFKSHPSLVINAAAIQGPGGSSWEVNPSDWKKTMEVNLLGAFHISHYALSYMTTGNLIHFSGGGAVAARPGLSAYACSKTALLRLVENLAEEVKLYSEKEILINAIAPGAQKTKMTQDILAMEKDLPDQEVDQAKLVLEQTNNFQKIYDLILFLVKERNIALSGKLIHVREPYKEISSWDKDLGVLRRKGLEE